MKKGDSNADVSESSKNSAKQSSENADSEKENASENIQSPTAGIKVNFLVRLFINSVCKKLQYI